MSAVHPQAAVVPAGRVEFLEIGFDPLTLAQATDWLAARGAGSHFGYVVTPNVDHVVRLARASGAVRAAYAGAALCLCDSRVLARLARLCGVVLPVAPGSDLTAALFARVVRAGDRIVIVGATDEDIERVRSLYPAFDFVHLAAPYGLREDGAARAELARKAVAAAGRFTLLAVGSPQQELIADAMAGEAGASGTGLCIGASVDFITGRQRRAPALVQRLGLEWGWRLGSDPRRLARRYLIDGPAIFPMVWRWRARRSKRAP